MINPINLNGHTGGIFVVKFTPNGKYLMSGSEDRTIRLWNYTQKKIIKTFQSPCREVFDLSIFNDNSKIVCCGADYHPFIVDVMTSQVLRRYKGHDGKINCLQLNEQQNVIGTGSYDMTVKLWDVLSNTNEPIMTLSGAKDSISSIQIRNNQILTTSNDGCLRCYDIRKGLLITDTIHQSLNCLSLIDDTMVVLSSSNTSSIILYDRSTQSIIKTYSEHKNNEYRITNSVSSDKKSIVTGDENGFVFKYNILLGTSQSLKVSNHPVCAVSCHPTKSMFAFGSLDQNVGITEY
ncbi:WD domain containing protein [Entamoeba marina]